MTLHRYFQRTDSVLPKPNSSLSTVVPAPTIVAANHDWQKRLLTAIRNPVRRTPLVVLAAKHTNTSPQRKKLALGKQRSTVFKSQRLSYEYEVLFCLSMHKRSRRRSLCRHSGTGLASSYQAGRKGEIKGTDV